MLAKSFHMDTTPDHTDDDNEANQSARSFAETVHWMLEAVRARGKTTVLLVDDDDCVRAVGEDLLNHLGFTVLTAVNGQDAIAVYCQRGEEIDVIMLDLHMPVMGGVETYRRLRGVSRDVPVIFCSGNDDEMIEESIESDRSVGFLEKPYKLDQLCETLLAHCGSAAEN